MSAGNDDGVLSRWSRRKASARRGRAAPVAVEDAETSTDLALETPTEAQTGELVAEDVPLADGVETDAATEEETVDVDDLPDVESLDKDSDFTPFLKKGVPEAISRAALRKLWLSDTVFANLDGLNDYDDNFRIIDKLISLADTNYRVGKGFLTEDEDDSDNAEVETAEIETLSDDVESEEGPSEGSDDATEPFENKDDPEDLDRG